jgi:hypothetical protein
MILPDALPPAFPHRAIAVYQCRASNEVAREPAALDGERTGDILIALADVELDRDGVAD